MESPLRRSIEVEYWVIDSEGRLTEPGSLVEASPGTEREFVKPLLEIKTTPCETTAQLQRELFARIEAVLQRADKLDKGLVPLGTPVACEEIEDIPNDRTRIQDCILGEDFDYVRHCAGTHIHVEQQPGKAIDQLNTLIALDPALALVNSSPYYEGEPLARSARSELYRRRAYDDLAHQGELWRYVDDINEWNRRLGQRYEEFRSAAEDAGVDRQAFISHFEPSSAIWTPVQLRQRFDTVEWRSADTALPSQIVSLADDIAGIIERVPEMEVQIDGNRGHVSDESIVLPTFDSVLEYVEAAISDGLESEMVSSYLDRMGFSVEEYDPIAADIAGEDPVDPETARQFRLDYSQQLKQDVAGRQTVQN